MTYIYLGPSLCIDEAKKVLDVHYLPPVRLGDIITLVREKKPKIIGLVDGYFTQTLPVWHKEILYALEKNVKVLGASSMGALRAAELAPFGMIGIGKVFDCYFSGQIEDDDEVALLHGNQESGYLNFSLPMVNIRFTLQRAQESALISEVMKQKWTLIAKSLFYPERTVDGIVQAGQMPGGEEALFRQIFETSYVDQKKEDALLLLNHIALNDIPARASQEPMHHTPLFQQLFHQDRSVSSEGEPILLRDLAKYIALHHPSFSQLRVNAINRMLVKTLVEMFSIEATEEEMTVEKQRFLMKQDLFFPSDVDSWLEANDLTEQEFDELMKDRAKAEKLYASPLGAGASWRLHKALFEELKLSNQYTDWLEKGTKHYAAFKKKAPSYLEESHEQIFDKEIFTDHIQKSDWDLEISVKNWCKEAGFHDLQELALELHKAKLARDEFI